MSRKTIIGGVVVVAMGVLPIATSASATEVNQATISHSVVRVAESPVFPVNAEVRDLARTYSGTIVPASATTANIDSATGAVTYRDSAGRVVAHGFWGNAVKVALCTAAIGAFIAGNAILVLKIRKIGGVARAVQKLIHAANATQRWQAALAIFGNVTGLGGVVSACS